MTATSSYSGGCLCGAVRYRAEGPPRSVVYCHCRMCQRAAGAPVVPWATFPAAGFAVSAGDIAEFASSPGARRGFCKRCGTPLTFREIAEPDWIDITVASLDDPAALPPQDHIWTESSVSWLRIDDDLPRHRRRRSDPTPA
ncbi:MAG: GFA family protein [Dongiaceae bacterium]